MNNPWLGWALALAAVVAGFWSYGWKGLVLAITAIAFWLLLQFSRALRTLRDAARAPVGSVANAVMLHSRLRTGMRLPEVLRLTGSLGRKVHATPAPQDGDEAWLWADAAGDEVQLLLRDGRTHSWQLKRAAPSGGAAQGEGQGPPEGPNAS
ncbi:MAG TPA: hypothetical protein VK570_05365 [Rubrivivax sp.]|nr:hypothetical protein [Rubrivivax sp.]